VRFVLCFLVACGADDGAGKKKQDQHNGPMETTEGAGGLLTQTWTLESASDGYFEVEVAVGAASQFMVTGMSDRLVYLEALVDPSGTTVLSEADWTGDRSLTDAVWGDTVSAFNWPVRAEDGPLDPGSWTVLYSTVDADSYEYAGGSEVDVALQTKPDGDLADGRVTASVIFADGVGADEAVVDAVYAAVERWTLLWGSVGVRLEATYYDADLDPDLGFVYTGSNEITELSAEGELTMVIGATVDNEAGTFGIAGGIPGTMTASPKSFVVVSWLVHAGADGEFSEQDVAIMGETMAHEGGHYLGLFHPVEMSYDAWDALGDTPECSDWDGCDAAMGHNLMYPYPVCEGDGCWAQDELTGDQAGVAHRYVGTL
jgi:hypothetical protein